MITIKDLHKSYKGHDVLKGIHLDVAEGEIYGFIGHNGAGKSTTMNILAGLIDFQSGECQIDGKSVEKGHPSLFKTLGYLPEEPRFYLYMNAWEYLNFIGRLGDKNPKEIRLRSQELLEMVKLTESAKRPIGVFSRGMRQRLGLAVAMFHDPKNLLLDEPSSALDPVGRKDVVDIIENLKQQGKTIFLSTHILGDVERVCDRIGILHGGKVVLEDRLETLLSEYIQPIYDIDFEVPPSPMLLQTLSGESYVKNCVQDGKRICVTVNNPESDGGVLLKDLSGYATNLIAIQLRRSSLEDVYMRVVKQDE